MTNNLDDRLECCSLSKGDDRRPGGVADKSEGYADIQRDFDKLEQQEEEPHEVQKREMQILALGKNNLVNWYSWRLND